MTTWSTRTAPTTTWSTRTAPSTTWNSNRDNHFLLQESLSFLLLETGDKILLNQF